MEVSHSMEVKQDKKSINDIVDTLNNNPLHHLSLSSNELFHSNFWGWLIKEKRNRNNSDVLRVFGIDPIKAGNIIEVVREKHNFDLLIETDKNFIVIENKLKSFPSKEQLQNYDKKINEIMDEKGLKPIKKLVSLFPYKFENEEGWESLDYKQIHENLNINYFSFDDEYEKAIFIKYKELIKSLSELPEALSNDIGQKDDFKYDFLFNDNLEKLEKARLADIYRKYRTNELALYISNKLQDNNIKIDYKPLSLKKLKNYKLNIYPNYSHKKGIVDIFLKLKEEIVIGLQIEGNQFRYVLNIINTNHQTSKKLREKYAQMLLNKEIWFKREKRKPEKNNNHKFTQSFENAHMFCGYNPGFIYQYEELEENVAYSEIFHKVLENIKFIYDSKDEILKILE